MMTPDERKLLSDLFERMRAAASAPRDREAEQMIAEAVRAQPYAPYLLAQTVLVQEEGLKAAASRIQELEAQVAGQQREQEGAGGFLGGIGKSIFGGGPSGARPTSVPQAGGQWSAPPPPPPRQGPWGAGPAGYGTGQGGFGGAPGGFGGAPGAFGGGGGGGFLRGALTTAAGVAGGALLFQGISNLFGSAHAAGPLAQSMADPSAMAAQTGVNDIFNSLPGAEHGSQPSAEHGQSASLQDASTDDNGDDPGYEDAGYEDDGGDDGGFDSGGDDGGDWT